MGYLVAYSSSSTPVGWADHPRILLDATAKSALQAKVSANTVEWQALKSWCDTNINTNITDGYMALNWYEYLLSYAAAFQATGDQTYGNKGVVYLKALLNDWPMNGPIPNAGEVGNGRGDGNLPTEISGYESFTTVMQIDSGYTARSIGDGVAIGRDWLDGATDLDQATIDLCATRMSGWINYVVSASPMYRDGGVTNNYGAAFFAMFSNAHLSMYGDPHYDEAWGTLTNSLWTTKAKPVLDAYKGDWPNWSYGDWAVRHILIYPVALYTATGDDSVLASIDYPSEMVKTIMHSLHPARDTMADHGRFYDPKGAPSVTATMDFLAEHYPLTATEKALCRWFTGNVTRTYTTPQKVYNFLWKNTTATQTEPTSTLMGALSRRSGGGDCGRLLARSDEWSNEAATFVDMSATMLDWETDNDENAMDFGAVKISARGVYLVKGASSANAFYARENNLPLIAGTHTYAPYAELWPDGTQAFSHSFKDGDYAYGKANNYQSYYDREHADLTYGSRSMVLLPPDLVLVYDNLTVPSAGTNIVTERWHFAAEPTTSDANNTATLVSGAAKIVQTYVNTPVTFATGHHPDSSSDMAVYYADATPETAATSNQILMAFECMDDDGSSAYTITALSVTGAKAWYVENASRSWVVVFTASTTGAALSGNLTIDITGTSHGFAPTIIVCDLAAGARYLKSESPTNVYTLTSVGSGGTAADASGVLVI